MTCLTHFFNQLSTILHVPLTDHGLAVEFLVGFWEVVNNELTIGLTMVIGVKAKFMSFHVLYEFLTIDF